MERNKDNDYTRVTSDYEPNFILKEPEDGSAAEENAPRRAIDPLKEAVSAPEPAKATDAFDKPVAPVNTQAASTEVAKATDLFDEMLAVADAAHTANTSEQPGIGAEGPQARPTTVQPERPASPSYDRLTAAQPGVTDAAQTRPEARPAGGRPAFENPSYDSGDDRDSKGSYVDPRRNFRSGASASWHGGRRSRADAGGSTAGDTTAPGMPYAPGRSSGSGGSAGTGPATTTAGKRPRRKPTPVTMSRKALAFLIIGCLLLSGLLGFGGSLVGHKLYSSHNNEQAPQTQAEANTTAKTETTGYNLESATGSHLSVKEITASAKDSVVEIRTEGVVSDTWMQEYVTEGAGSGVIISEDGYIMTNNHVISGAKKIKVTTSNEKEYEAKLIGADENNDVAVIKIDATGLKAATYGNSDELEVGDLAVAIGNPLGELGGTVTAGIISAKDRALSIDGKTLHLLQTDSSINPGNSGGGLFNDSGQLIGLVVAKSAGSDVEGLGFAIPVNTAASVAQQLMDKGYVSGQPSTGMTYQEGSSGGFGTFDSVFGGSSQTQVYIYSVNGDNAKKAGFKSGDIVLAIDGEEVSSFDDLSAIVTSHKVGDTITYTIYRDGSEKKIKLQLEEKKNSTNQAKDGSSADPGKGNEMEKDPQQGNGEIEPEDGYSSIPENNSGSLFDFFFGW